MAESEIIRVNGLDVDKNVEFYGPISPIYCFFFGVPTNVYGEAAKLNGQRTSICEATDRISAVTDLTVFISTNNKCISLRLGPAKPFCLIKFR